MESLQVLERRSDLVLPNSFQELDREEMTYVDGGGEWTSNYYDLGYATTLFLGISVGSVYAEVKALKVATQSVLKGILAGAGWAITGVLLTWGIVNFIIAASSLSQRGYYTVHEHYVKVFGLSIKTGVVWAS
jgi:hypothetical protein